MRNAKGFTIVELLIVIVVIGIIASITVVAFQGMRARATNSNTQAMISQYEKAILAYRQDNGQYPSGASACLGGAATTGENGNECFSGDGSYAINPGFDSMVKGYLGSLPAGSRDVTTATYSGTTYNFNVAGMYTFYYGQYSLWYILLNESTCPSGHVESPYDATNGIMCVRVFT